MSIKSKIQSLIASINSKTGETDTNLTDAVQTLVDGFGGAKEVKYMTGFTLGNSPTPPVIQEDLNIDLNNYPSLVYGKFATAFRQMDVGNHKIAIRNYRFTDCTSLFSGTSNMTEALIDFGETKPTNFYGIFYVSGNTLKKVTITGDTSQVTNWNYAFRHSEVLETIDADLDFSSATSLSSVFYQNGNNPTNVRVVPHSIKVDFNFNGNGTNMTNASTISFANGLDGTATDKTIAFANATKNKLSSIIGHVDDDGIFVEDENGDTNLHDFITINKGWLLG